MHKGIIVLAVIGGFAIVPSIMPLPEGAAPDAPAKKVEKVFSQRDKDVFAAAVVYEQALNEAAALPRSQISVSFHRTCDETGQTLYDAASDKGLKSTIWRVWDRCADFK